MGVEDSIAADGLQFHELARAIEKLLEDSSSETRYCGSGSTSQLIASSYVSLPGEDTTKYYLRVLNKISDVRREFIVNLNVIETEIEEKMNKLLLLIETRKIHLRNKLRMIAAEKLQNWERQSNICEKALSVLHPDRFSKNESIHCQKTLGYQVTNEINFIDSGDIKFELENYTDVLKLIPSIGNILYHSTFEWRTSDAFKELAPKFTFGRAGDQPGEFCRPWGVFSDRRGRILVCDRSNHRIQIFSESGEFLYQFGKEGSKPGEFRRPTGVEVDPNDRIIVADKDNHRIQVLSYCGDFLFEFGTQGTAPGKFMYPWDVAVNSLCFIAVSDSKNHRVQLFNKNGVLVKYFDPNQFHLKNHKLGLRILDSPRGIAFRPDGSLMVTDFNNHKIIILDAFLEKFSYFGGEGMEVGKFFRPQGIACDKHGNFVVADSKNYRIQMFDSEGKIKYKFGSQGNKPGEFDCPQGVSLHINGSIIVVDLTNNRVQVF